MLLSQVFHNIEKKIIRALRDIQSLTFEQLAVDTDLSPDQLRRGIEWLRLKSLVSVAETAKTTVRLDKNGIDALQHGLAERRLVDLVRYKQQKISDLQKHLGDLFGPSMGTAKKNDWIQANNDEISIKNYPDPLPTEKLLDLIGKDGILLDSISDIPSYDLLKKRPNFIAEDTVTSKTVSLSDSAKNIDIDTADDAINVEADVPLMFCARRHPLKDTIDEIREIFVTLGFAEIIGNLSQSSFWNFDALFTPQDHPAREMQDTFFLDKTSKRVATAKQLKNVAASHKQGWRYRWDIREAQKMVLRTHTTCVTIKHLAECAADESRTFSLGRVFRNEKPSYKHLVEFHQIEGVLVGKNATLRDLMGIQKEFYKRIGITKVRFWPTFFPYTEPSLQTMVYNSRLDKWVELFGMGMFRPQVTKPLGITKPVLAWGGGIERIAMLKYGLDDVRQFYNNDFDWLRNASKCQ